MGAALVKRPLPQLGLRGVARRHGNRVLAMKCVIDPGTAIALADRGATVPAKHTLLAPTLLRSHVLAILYADVQRGARARKDAMKCLEYLRGLQIRLLGDRVLQRVAWEVAERLGWHDTFVAEYVALTKLQGDLLITTSGEFAASVRDVVRVGDIAELLT